MHAHTHAHTHNQNKILVVCRHALRKWDVRGCDYTGDAQPSHALYLYCASIMTNKCNRGEAAKVDAIREQQLKQTQSGGSRWSGCNWGAVGSGHTRLASACQRHWYWCVRVGGYARLTMKEARPQHKLTYVCREGRTVSANTNGGVVTQVPLGGHYWGRTWIILVLCFTSTGSKPGTSGIFWYHLCLCYAFFFWLVAHPYQIRHEVVCCMYQSSLNIFLGHSYLFSHA